MPLPAPVIVLYPGRHQPGSGKACATEVTSLLAGERWSDRPACVHPVLAAAARAATDRADLTHEQRQALVPLLPGLLDTAETGTSLERRVLLVRLAAWAARAEAACGAGAYAATATATADATATAYAAAGAGAAVRATADPVALLAGLIAEYDRLTGRAAWPDVTSEQWAAAAEQIGQTR